MIALDRHAARSRVRCAKGKVMDRLKLAQTLVVAGGLTLLGGYAALAQDATPAAGGAFASLGLPELAVTLTADGIQVDQSAIPAGRYLVTFRDETNNPEGNSAGFVRLVEGKTLADLSWADELAAGTPPPSEEGPPTEDEWLYSTYITGGGSTFSPQVVIDLPAGDYGVWLDDPTSTVPATALTVSGDAEAQIAGPEPEAAVTIVEEGAGGQGFHFTVQGAFQAGPQVVKIHNTTDQPHFIVVFQYPEPITQEQLTAAMAFDPTSGATPPPDMIDMEQLAFAGWVGTQSPGTTQWETMDLQAGQAILMCFVSDPKAGGVPHAFEGMMALVPVAAS
jgi:hypothetical protein